MKILLPLDLTQPVEPIVTSLNALVDLSKADVKLLYVHEMLPAYENSLRTSGQFSDDWGKQYDDRAREMLHEAEGLLKSKCKSVSSELANGPTAMTIESVAKNEHHDMTVLVPRERHGARRFFGSGITNKVVQHAPGIVLILRKAPTKLSNVVIGHDGSKNSEGAIRRAAQTFNFNGAPKVCLVHAVDLAEPLKLLSPVAFVSAMEQNALMKGEAFLAEGEKLLVDGGVKNIDLRLIEADPAEGMITMAEETSADLVVIGAQGHSAVEHFLIGSVSHTIATNVPCSVAVIKPTSTK